MAYGLSADVSHGGFCDSSLRDCAHMPSSPPLRLFLHPAARSSEAAILDHEIRIISGGKTEGPRGHAMSAPSASSHVYTREKPSSFSFKPLLIDLGFCHSHLNQIVLSMSLQVTYLMLVPRQNILVS